MTDPPLTVYAVRISAVASAQAVAGYDRLTETAGTAVAEDWRVGLLDAWAGLATLPLRCPIAAEDGLFQPFHPGTAALAGPVPGVSSSPRTTPPTTIRPSSRCTNSATARRPR